MNGNIEAQIQEIRELLQLSAQVQAQVSANLARTEKIAESNAKSIQAWEALIEQNKIEAEEERSRLAVRITDLEIASQDNIQQHFQFFQRFDETQASISRILDRLRA